MFVVDFDASAAAGGPASETELPTILLGGALLPRGPYSSQSLVAGTSQALGVSAASLGREGGGTGIPQWHQEEMKSNRGQVQPMPELPIIPELRLHSKIPPAPPPNREKIVYSPFSGDFVRSPLKSRKVV